MASPTRAGVFETEDGLDVSGFAPKPAERPAARPEQVRAVSEATRFQSREPRREAPFSSASKREPRRYRTGRNIQLNIKARAGAIRGLLCDRRSARLGVGRNIRAGNRCT